MAPSFPTHDSFYQKLPSFTDFSKVFDDVHYIDVPDDWFVLLTDVKGSTEAIAKGRYKQVNLIGAASITCVLNCLGPFPVPFVFGGDGATLVIPSFVVEKVVTELKGLQLIAKNQFSIDLRVGLVSLKDLKEKNFQLKVAKYKLSEGNYLAQFRGGGLAEAESRIKKNHSSAQVITPLEMEKSPNLLGLSCRLNPLQSRKGEILSLICKPRNGEAKDSTLNTILNELRAVLGNDLSSASPVSEDRLGWRYVAQNFKDEVYLSRNGRSFFVTVLDIIIRNLIVNTSLKKNIRLGPFLPAKYKSELVINSDFKKFDEMLRMVIDCTPDQVRVIEKLLEAQFQKKSVFYGLHRSSEALMTCMVFSASQNQHVHFVDGSNGGYALAALAMKKQIANATV